MKYQLQTRLLTHMKLVQYMPPVSCLVPSWLGSKHRNDRYQPLCRICKVTNLLEVIHAVQSWENLTSMAKKIREDVVHVAGADQDVAQDDVKVNFQSVHLHDQLAERDESLVKEVTCKLMK